MIYALANAQRLAAARIAILLVCVVDVALDPFVDLALLPRAWFTGHGPWALLPAALIDALWSRAALYGLKLATLGALSLALIGVPHARRWAGGAALLLTLTWGFVRGFGHADHSQLQLLFMSCLLPFLPAWDVLAASREAPKERREGEYAGGFVALAVVFGFPYFLTGAARFALEGYRIFAGDAMQHFIARESLALDDFEFTLGLSLLDRALRPLLNLSFFGVTLAELVSPWAYLRRSLTLGWLLFLLPFHLLAPFLMHIFFPHNVALLTILYLWPLTWSRRRM